MDYRVVKIVEEGVETQHVIATLGNGSFRTFPMIPGNRHYEEYLQWVAEGNEPEVIEDPNTPAE